MKRTTRHTSMYRQGVVKHLSKSQEARNLERERKASVKALEAALREEQRLKVEEEKLRREEKAARRMANEFKSSSFQQVLSVLRLKMCAVPRSPLIGLAFRSLQFCDTDLKFMLTSTSLIFNDVPSTFPLPLIDKPTKVEDYEQEAATHD